MPIWLWNNGLFTWKVVSWIYGIAAAEQWNVNSELLAWSMHVHYEREYFWRNIEICSWMNNLSLQKQIQFSKKRGPSIGFTPSSHIVNKIRTLLMTSLFYKWWSIVMDGSSLLLYFSFFAYIFACRSHMRWYVCPI